MWSFLKSLVMGLALAGLLSCGSSADKSGDPTGSGGGKTDCPDCPDTPPEDEDLVRVQDGRDTGYYSDLGAEIVGVFKGQLTLIYDEGTDLEAEAEQLRQDSWALGRLTDGQLELAKNQLNTAALHMNLSSSSPSDSTVTVDAEARAIVVDYEITAESVVSYEELEREGINIEDMINRTNEATVPKDPRQPVTRMAKLAAADNPEECRGEDGAPLDEYNDKYDGCIKPYVDKCASDYDDHIRDFNFFYYFDPKPECASVLGEMTSVSFVAQNLVETTEIFPEFDKLMEPWSSTYNVRVASGEIEQRSYEEPANVVSAVILFGAAGHEDEVSYWDWGPREQREFVRFMTDRGFEDKGVYTHEWIKPEEGGEDAELVAREVGRRYIRERNSQQQRCTFGQDADCTRVVLDVVSPFDLHDLKKYSQSHSADGLFHQALRTHEIMLYAGHSFYGSLDVLDEPENYPAGVYQVLFMASCWSYEYYTKQVFANKASDADAATCDADHGCTGWALTDVVNDTESGWFHNNAEEARIVLTNLFRGAQAQGYEAASDRIYTWNGIVDRMNEHALDAWERHGTETHEIFGVSGVRTNSFCPAASGVCE